MFYYKLHLNYLIYTFTKESLNKIDDQRKKAERKTILANKNLEKKNCNTYKQPNQTE
jgi:hypothetical protein